MNNLPLLTERKPQGITLAEKMDSLIDLMKKVIDEKTEPKFPEVMTAKQVQEFLQISNQTFYDLKNAGVIRTADIGPKRYLKSEIYKTLIDHLI